jgi:hypothetical protein
MIQIGDKVIIPRSNGGRTVAEVTGIREGCKLPGCPCNRETLVGVSWTERVPMSRYGNVVPLRGNPCERMVERVCVKWVKLSTVEPMTTVGVSRSLAARRGF